jgi:Na+-transporting NADH:ubiquinone oxidoreductase subunit F
MIILASNTTVILISIAVFLVIILALVIILLYARKKLTPQGEVELKVNDKKYKVEPGNTILSALSSQGIYLPSACGGQGTCGLCTCQVLEGGGDILPTEKDFFSRKEEMNNWRLGCQVKIRNDMTIKVPPEVMDIKKYECEVVSNKNVATFIKEFVVRLPEGEDLNFEPGGYIQLDVPKITVDFSSDVEVEEEYKDEWDRFGMWDLVMKNSEETFRAYSMANHPAEGNIVKLNVRIATPPWDRSKGRFKNVNPGICSSYVFSRKPGDRVTLSGPYGDFFIKHTDKEMVYVGGGAGMAPLRSHIFHLFRTLQTNRKVSYWYGARSLREIFYEEDFRQLEREFPNFSFHIALSEPKEEDNWDGPVGFIHQVVYDQYLSTLEEPEEIEYYLCGPPVMNDAVQDMLYNMGVPQEMIAFDDFGG